MIEVIGEYGQQIKPMFDIDAYGNDINIIDVKKQSNILFPDKIVNFTPSRTRTKYVSALARVILSERLFKFHSATALPPELWTYWKLIRNSRYVLLDISSVSTMAGETMCSFWKLQST